MGVGDMRGGERMYDNLWKARRMTSRLFKDIPVFFIQFDMRRDDKRISPLTVRSWLADWSPLNFKGMGVVLQITISNQMCCFQIVLYRLVQGVGGDTVDEGLTSHSTPLNCLSNSTAHFHQDGENSLPVHLLIQ